MFNSNTSKSELNRRITDAEMRLNQIEKDAKDASRYLSVVEEFYDEELEWALRLRKVDERLRWRNFKW